METIAKIRRYHFVKGLGIKTIRRKLGISKNTVHKVVRSETITTAAFGNFHLNPPCYTTLKDNMVYPIFCELHLFLALTTRQHPCKLKA